MGAKVCPYCHMPYPVKPRSVEQVEGQLREVDIRELRGQLPLLKAKCRSLSDFQALGKRLQFKPGWAWHCFHAVKVYGRRLATGR